VQVNVYFFALNQQLASPQLHDPYAALRIPDFRLYVSARLLVTLSLQMQGVLVGLQIYMITRDPLALGLIGMAEFLPFVMVVLYAGHVADTNSRKKIMLITLGVLVLCSSGLFLFSLGLPALSSLTKGSMELPGLTLTGLVIPIYALIFLSGIARGFMAPAAFALMPQLIPGKEFYGNAVTWNSAVWQIASVTGQALSGMVYYYVGDRDGKLYSATGFAYSYLLIVIMLLIAFLLLMIIAERPVAISEDFQNIGEKLSAGIRFVSGNPVILGALTLDLFAVLFGGAVALLPIYADEILNVGAQGLGFLRAAPALGAVAMALYITYHPIRKNAGKKMMLCVAGFGVCMILFGISENFALSLLILTVGGAFDSVSVIIRATLIHTLTPEHMKGRVGAVNNIFIGSSNELGQTESGIMAKLMGTVASVVFGGGMTIAIAGITALKAVRLRNLDLTQKPN
jgi:MFS family permease